MAYTRWPCTQAPESRRPQRFQVEKRPSLTGRAVGALLNKTSKETLERYSGKVVQTAELAVDYSFTDVGGAMPDGPFSRIEAGKRCREAMSQPLFQYNLDAERPDPMETNNTDIAVLFPDA